MIENRCLGEVQRHTNQGEPQCLAASGGNGLLSNAKADGKQKRTKERAVTSKEWSPKSGKLLVATCKNAVDVERKTQRYK